MSPRFLKSLGVGDGSENDRGRPAGESQSRRSHPSSSRHESDKEKMKLRLASKSKSRGTTKTGSERESRSRKSVLAAKKRTLKVKKTGVSKHEKKRVGNDNSSSEDDKNKAEEPKEKAAYSEASIGAFPVTPSVSSVSLSHRRRSTLKQETKSDVFRYISSDNNQASDIYQHQPNRINVFAFQSDWSSDEDDLEDLPTQYESATDSYADDSQVDESAPEEVSHDNYLSESGGSEMADTLPMDIHPERSWLSHPVSPPSYTGFAIDDNPTPMPGHSLNAGTFPLTASPSHSSPNSSFGTGNSTSASQASTAPTEASLSPELAKPSPLRREEEVETPQETPTWKPVSEQQHNEPPPDATTAKVKAQVLAAERHRRNRARRRSSIPCGGRHPDEAYQAAHLSTPALQISDAAYLFSTSIDSSPEPKPATAVHKYRTFTSLQHRLLSSLQNEIAALENQLDNLDAQLSELNNHLASTGAGNSALVNSTSELHWWRSQLVEHIASKLKVFNTVREDMAKASQTENQEEKREVEMPEAVKQQLRLIEEMTEKVALAQKTMLRLTGVEEEPVVVVPKETREEKMRREKRLAIVLASVLVPLLIFPFIRNFGGRVVVALFVGAYCWSKARVNEVVVEGVVDGGEGEKDDVPDAERHKRKARKMREQDEDTKSWEEYTPVIGAGVWGVTMLLMAGIVR